MLMDFVGVAGVWPGVYRPLTSPEETSGSDMSGKTRRPSNLEISTFPTLLYCNLLHYSSNQFHIGLPSKFKKHSDLLRLVLSPPSPFLPGAVSSSKGSPLPHAAHALPSGRDAWQMVSSACLAALLLGASCAPAWAESKRATWAETPGLADGQR